MYGHGRMDKKVHQGEYSLAGTASRDRFQPANWFWWHHETLQLLANYRKTEHATTEPQNQQQKKSLYNIQAKFISKWKKLSLKQSEIDIDKHDKFVRKSSQRNDSVPWYKKKCH